LDQRKCVIRIAWQLLQALQEKSMHVQNDGLQVEALAVVSLLQEFFIPAETATIRLLPLWKKDAHEKDATYVTQPAHLMSIDLWA
jgi:hypothetical protein